MISRLFCLFMLAILCAPAEAAERRGRLNVLVTDIFGTALEHARVQVSSASEPPRIHPVSKSFSFGYGTYTIKASAPGFVSAEKVVKVYSTEVLAVLTLQVGHLGGRSYRVLNGRITGLPAAGLRRSAYVRLIPVFGQTDSTAAIDAEGRFTIVEFDPGDNLLLVIDRGKVLGQKQLNLSRDLETVEVLLKN